MYKNQVEFTIGKPFYSRSISGGN